MSFYKFLHWSFAQCEESHFCLEFRNCDLFCSFVQSCANVVVSELWGLVEVECEELRVLQTVPPLVSADLLVTGNTLAKVSCSQCPEVSSCLTDVL